MSTAPNTACTASLFGAHTSCGHVLCVCSHLPLLTAPLCRSLDKKVRPGLTKLTWATQGNLDQFVGDCRMHATRVTQVIESYKSSNRNIGQHCREISEMMMVWLDGRRVFEGDEFEQEQRQHRETVLGRMKEIYMEILHKMRRMSEVFMGDGGEVHLHWVKYTERMDRMVEEALRLNVKWSLQELSRAINGDGKTSPNPLFKVNVTLEDRQVGRTTVRVCVCVCVCVFVLLLLCLCALSSFRSALSRPLQWWTCM